MSNAQPICVQATVPTTSPAQSRHHSLPDEQREVLQLPPPLPQRPLRLIASMSHNITGGWDEDQGARQGLHLYLGKHGFGLIYLNLFIFVSYE